ncbi:MAG: NifB/NifX family molybdenum-iron cluster-binding protein [Lachnospiraceae bacterium]|nr:NifB/NifX family molybdenum-iron cluster-binding protein [Lachnospiraceae bacterium]
MPRPPRCRRICNAPRVERFGPCDAAESDPILLTLDEYEVIRLVDLEQQTHEQCAAQMDISRSTVQEIYESARRKLAACLVYGKPLHITGGNVRICSGQEQRYGNCHRADTCNRPSPDETCGKPGVDSACCTFHLTSDQKGDIIMRIAVTYENGQIFQHFGHTEQFKIYDVADGQIVREAVVDTNGSGHGALAGFLMQLGVDALICGGIGGGAQMALAEVGIRLFGGVSGDADAAVNALIAGNLGYNPDVHCDHHDHEHGEGGHSCGNHGCGNHGCH